MGILKSVAGEIGKAMVFWVIVAMITSFIIFGIYSAITVTKPVFSSLTNLLISTNNEHSKEDVRDLCVKVNGTWLENSCTVGNKSESSYFWGFSCDGGILNIYSEKKFSISIPERYKNKCVTFEGEL